MKVVVDDRNSRPAASGASGPSIRAHGPMTTDGDLLGGTSSIFLSSDSVGIASVAIIPDTSGAATNLMQVNFSSDFGSYDYEVLCTASGTYSEYATYVGYIVKDTKLGTSVQIRFNGAGFANLAHELLHIDFMVF